MKWRTRFAFAVGMLALAVGLSQLNAGGILLKKEDIPKTIHLLKTGTPAQKAAAAEALGRRGAVRVTDIKEAIDPLKKAVTEETDARVRAAAARALGLIGAEPRKDTVNLLLKTLQQDKADDVKIEAMRAIGRMGSEARPALPEIRKIAKDKQNKRLSQAAREVMKSLKN